MLDINLISCPHPDCGYTTAGETPRLEFLPMLGGVVYVQCPCGYGWELERKPEMVQ